MKITNVEEYLKKHGVKPSYQRLRIFEYLIKYRNHPTVDNIYQELVLEIPTLSKTTVYNTLKLFLEKGLVQVLVIEGNEIRYDADVSTHAHFKCEECGKVYDLFMDLNIDNIAELKDFLVKERHIYFKGICKKCLKK